MKLYYSPGACSLAPHIVLEELGIEYRTGIVNLRETPSPEFLKLNPLGAVPVVELDDGKPLTEVAVILQYLADSKPELKLAPRPGTMERVRLQEELNFLSTEIHKGFSPLWGVDAISQLPAAREDIRAFAVAQLGARFDILSVRLAEQDYLMPEGYTVADAYLFTLLTWTHPLKVDLARWPALIRFQERVRARPATQRALKAEHLK